MTPKIYTAPKVTLIARQQFIYPEHIDWRSDLTAAGDEEIYEDARAGEVLAEFAGRLCYLSFGEGEIDGHKTIQGRTSNAAYLDNILKVKHGSVIEHAVYSILIEGVSRSLTHELVRHRAGLAYSQLSQRYVDESAVAFVLPPELQHDTKRLWEREVFERSCADAMHRYQQLLVGLEAELAGVEGLSTTDRKKRARQTARSVLPNATETKIVVSGNVRALRHLIEMRGGAGADIEIRNLAVAILAILQEEAPHFFGDYTVTQVPEVGPVISTLHPKV